MAVAPREGQMGNVGPSKGNQFFCQFWEFLQERPLAGTSLKGGRQQFLATMFRVCRVEQIDASFGGE